MQTSTSEYRTQLRVEAPDALRRRLKARAAERGVSMQSYVAEAIEEKLAAEDAGRRDEGRRG